MSARSNYATPAPLETRLDLHRRFSVDPEGWHRWVLRRLALRPGSTVLELGCGTGALWQAADALAAYVASLPLGLSDERVSAVRDAAARHIDDHGALYLNKDAGLIEPMGRGRRQSDTTRTWQ